MAIQKHTNQGALMYLCITGMVFIAGFVVFLFFPRPEYSELEKRELGSFPQLQDHKDHLPGYTSAISDWFSNTGPFRDSFLTMSMNLRDKLKFPLRSNDDAVSFIATAESMDEGTDTGADEASLLDEDPEITLEENAKVANAGIIVAGNAPDARAMMVYGGSGNSGNTFISTVNNYADAFPSSNIYVVVAPSAGEFYMPEKVKSRNKSIVPTLEHIKADINPRVNYVDAYSAIRKHTDQDIFLRTDHHWAPLGAFYAAEALAQKANLPFRGLDSYDKNVIHNFVGSMYGYSKDIAVKNSPEDFVYYTPKGIDYTTTFITYKTNSDFQVISQSSPYKSDFFKKFKDGSGNAYLTFMGGDAHLVHVNTGASSGRKILIIKDSFGNPVPGYLFYSFSDIFVVDFRYFNKNMKKFVDENGITDIAFVFNVFNVCNNSTFRRVNNFLTQQDGVTVKEKPAEQSKDKKGDEKEVSKENTIDLPVEEPTKEVDNPPIQETKPTQESLPEQSSSTEEPSESE